MIIETIALIALLFGAAVLTLATIRNWLRQQTANRYGDLIKQSLKDGKVEIVAIGLTAEGKKTGQRTWRAKSLDAELDGTFGDRQRVRITL